MTDHDGEKDFVTCCCVKEQMCLEGRYPGRNMLSDKLGILWKQTDSMIDACGNIK
jgi:hypothetical protein